MRVGSVSRLMTMVIAVIYDQSDIDRGEQREDQGLNKADQQLHEVEGEKETCAVKEAFSTEHVAKKPDRKSDWSNSDRDHFNNSDEKKNEREDVVERDGSFFLVRLIPEQVEEENLRPRELHNDDKPGTERNGRQSDGAIEVGRERTDQGRSDVKVALRVRVSPPDRAHSGQQPHPVLEENKNEECDQERESEWECAFANDGLKQVAEAFDQ